MNAIALVVLLFGSLQMVHCKPVLEQNSEQSLEHKYSGVVLDAETLLPIPGATVLTPNQKGGTYCNSNGKFVLTTKTSLTYFIVRSVGYKQDTVRTNKESSSYTVRLQSQAKQTTNIVVQADKRAEDIVRTVLERMLRLRASVKELHYTEYTLEHVESNRKNGVKTALEKLKSVTKKYVPDEYTRIQIMSSRFLGSSDTAVIIDEFSSEVDHLQNPFIIDGMEYSYPLSINGLKHYNYSIEKRNEEQECSTVVRFEPKLLFSRGFSGTVHICERDTTFLEVELELQNSALPALFHGYKLLRKYDAENPRLWFPVADSLLLSMKAVVFTGLVTIEQHKRNYRKLKDFEFFDEIVIQDDSMINNKDTTLVQLHSILTDSMVVSIDSSKRAKPDTSKKVRFATQGYYLAKVLGADLLLLPEFFRSENKAQGYGLRTLFIKDSYTVSMMYGLSTDQQKVYDISLSSKTILDKYRTLEFMVGYESVVNTVQREFLQKTTFFDQVVKQSYPEHFSYLRENALRVGVGYSLYNTELQYRGSFTTTSTTINPGEIYNAPIYRQFNRRYVVNDLGATFRDDDALLRIGLRLGTSLDTFALFQGMYSELKYSVGTFSSIDGPTLRGTIQYAISSVNTPSLYAQMAVPRFTFMGDETSMVTLKSNDVFTRNRIVGRLELDCNDLLWRVLDLPGFDGIKPQLSFVVQALSMHNVQSLSGRSILTNNNLNLYETGVKLHSIPLFLTNLFQLGVEAKWAVHRNATFQVPFKATFELEIPLFGK